MNLLHSGYSSDWHHFVYTLSFSLSGLFKMCSVNTSLFICLLSLPCHSFVFDMFLFPSEVTVLAKSVPKLKILPTKEMLLQLGMLACHHWINMSCIICEHAPPTFLLHLSELCERVHFSTFSTFYLGMQWHSLPGHYSVISLRVALMHRLLMRCTYGLVPVLRVHTRLTIDAFFCKRSRNPPVPASFIEAALQ